MHKGESIALVGPTGGGKSTIVNLAARFYEPNDGQVLINGVDFRDRSLQWWQAQFGIVQQILYVLQGMVHVDPEVSYHTVEGRAQIHIIDDCCLFLRSDQVAM